MKQTKRLSAVIDGVSISVDLKYPLPTGFRLQTVLSDDQATAELKQAGLDEYLREAAAEVEKMTEECVENAFYFKAFLKPKSYMAFVVMTRRGVIKRFLFVFDHRGVRFVNETGKIISAAISSILTDLNWKSAGEEGQAAIL